jgi:hypothetical protein
MPGQLRPSGIGTGKLWVFEDMKLISFLYKVVDIVISVITRTVKFA